MVADPYLEVFCGRQPPEERAINWKGARKILSCSDDAIHLVSESPSGKCYYTVLGTTLTFDPRRKSHPLRCLKPQCGVRGDCPHRRRLERWRREHGL